MKHPSELIKMADRWGRFVYVCRSDWDGTRQLLTLYRSTGISVRDHAERMNQINVCGSIHRDNLRPNGYNKAEEDALTESLLAYDRSR